MSAVIDPGHRPLGLETDVANSNFAGAQNPDNLLWVQFSMRAMPDNFNSNLQGRPIFVDQLWIEIRIPGNAYTIIERPADDGDKRRFPRQWAFFEQTHSADGQNTGTPLSQWPLLRPSQIEELKALKFYTVDQLAFASDQQVASVGMIAGMAPLALRERAKLYLESARDNASAVKREEENRALHAKLEAQAKEMAELREMVKEATERRPLTLPKKKDAEA